MNSSLVSLKKMCLARKIDPPNEENHTTQEAIDLMRQLINEKTRQDKREKKVATKMSAPKKNKDQTKAPTKIIVRKKTPAAEKKKVKGEQCLL